MLELLQTKARLWQRARAKGKGIWAGKNLS